MGQKTITVRADVRLPNLPNFLLFKQDGGTLDVADVTEDGLREIGAAWTEALVAHAERRRQAQRATDAQE